MAVTWLLTGSWGVQGSYLYWIWYSSQPPRGYLSPSCGLPNLLWAPGYRPLKGSCIQTIDLKGERGGKRERLRPPSSSSFPSFSPTMPPYTTMWVYWILILFKAKGLWRGKEGCLFIHYVELSSHRREEAPMIIHPSDGILSENLREITSFWLEEPALCFPSSLRNYFSFSLKINHMTLNPPFWKPTRSPYFISWVPTGVRCCVWRLPGFGRKPVRAVSIWVLQKGQLGLLDQRFPERSSEGGPDRGSPSVCVCRLIFFLLFCLVCICLVRYVYACLHTHNTHSF